MMYSIVWMCIYNYNYIDIYDIICLIEILMAATHPFQPSAAPAVGGINPIQAWRLLRFHQKYTWRLCVFGSPIRWLPILWLSD